MSAVLQRLHTKDRDIGFTVRRALPAATLRSLGPFVFLDHMGPERFPVGNTEGDVRPHPHIGLATVTYLFTGAMMHRDSLGSLQRIEPGAVNWMTSGSGIVHSERVPEDVREHSTPVEGIQMWVALPRELEATTPGFWHYGAEVLPVVEGAGSRVRVLCGKYAGKESPVKTTSPTFYLAVELRAGGSITLDTSYTERGFYVACGSVQVDGEQIEENELVQLAAGEPVTITAVDEVRLMVLGGEPLDGPRHIWWNFVASSREAIEEAKERWSGQKFGVVPGETEFIPLPER